MEELTILHEDNHVIVVLKPQNIPTCEDASKDLDMLTIIKDYIKKTYNKQGNVYLGLVHRLDRPTGGVMVFAKSSKAAARLSEQLKNGEFEKRYYTVLVGEPKEEKATLTHYLKKNAINNMVYVCPSSVEGAKFAELEYQVLETVNDGNRIVRFEYDGLFENVLDELGEMPLPPYITEKLQDKDRYQTVYSKHEGSAAAPTAGLHFTKELLCEIEKKGIEIAYVTLHVGLGTFRPVKVENAEEHKMHSEFFVIDKENADKINRAKQNGGRIISVGTTSTRVLETVASEDGVLKEQSGWTDIFIYPPYKFKCVDCLITNFHLPESTLLMLVSAFSSKENIMHAYEEAVKEKYRFFSFGDAMFIK